MDSKKLSSTVRQLLGIGILTCGVLAQSAWAIDHEVTVGQRVNAAGLDLNEPAGAQAFYARLKRAAWVVCTHGNRVDLVPADNVRECFEKALANAVRLAKAPLVMRVYQANHVIKGGDTGWSYVPVPEGSK